MVRMMGSPKRPKMRSAAVPREKVVAGDLVHGQDVEDGGVHQEINAHDGEDAAEDGARDVFAGVADFFAEVDDAVPTVDGVENGLEAEHQRDGERPAGSEGELGGGCRGECGGAVGVAAENEAGDDEDDEGGGFHGRGD